MATYNYDRLSLSFFLFYAIIIAILQQQAVSNASYSIGKKRIALENVRRGWKKQKRRTTMTEDINDPTILTKSRAFDPNANLR